MSNRHPPGFSSAKYLALAKEYKERGLHELAKSAEKSAIYQAKKERASGKSNRLSS